MIFIAAVGVKDFDRNGVRQTLDECKEAGIQIRLLVNEGRQHAIVAATEAGLINKNDQQKIDDKTVMEGREFRNWVANIKQPKD